MRVSVPIALERLADYIEPFLELSGKERWFKRTDQLYSEAQKSPYQGKTVADYHWLEMAISFQADVLAKERRLLPELVTKSIQIALNFAAMAVEVHSALSPRAKLVMEGRIRDALQAETGFASLYQELDLAQRLMDAGYEVHFCDMEGTARCDLYFSRGSFTGEVECKSISADAGRQIHRKDFYRFMEMISPTLERHVQLQRKEVLAITLKSRLSQDILWQAELAEDSSSMLSTDAPPFAERGNAKFERVPLSELLEDIECWDEKLLYDACIQRFGASIHVAGKLTKLGGCIIAMRSERSDDISKPLLEAMRKAANQLSGKYPAFIAIQEHDIEAPDLMLPHVRRRMAILSYALFRHYGATHVNATYVTGFGAVVDRQGVIGTPAFSVANPNPAFPVKIADAVPFLDTISDQDYADAIGSPLLVPNISMLPL